MKFSLLNKPRKLPPKNWTESMFPSKFQLRSKSVRSQLRNRSNSALFVTHTSVCEEERQEHRHHLEESITNRSYWTRKIHKLCAIDCKVDEAIFLVDKLCIHGYRLDSLNLSSIIHALCDSNRFAEAHRRFLSSLSSYSRSGFIIPDERTCNVIIARLLDWGKNPHLTLRIVHRIIAVKPHFVPSLTNFNRLINQLCSFSQVHSAHILFFHMKSLGHRPNEVSYTTLINGYCKIGELGSALNLLDEMSECGVRPNPLTYSVLISGAIRNRDTKLQNSLLEKLWTTMADEDANQIVNHAAFSNLIYTLCQEGMFKSIFDIAEQMPQGKNNMNNAFVYSQMIDSLCRYGRHHGASRIIYMMMKQRYVPSSVSYNSVIHGLTKTGGYLRAYQLLEQGIEFGYTPSENTYKILIECLCLEEHDLRKAKKLLEIMLSKKGMDKARIFNIYIKSLSQMSKDSSTELLNTLLIMLETKCHPDIFTLNTVINGFCKMRKLEDAMKVLNDMVMGNFNFCTPDSVTFTTIISGLLDVGRTKDALQVLYKVMPEKGFHPRVRTYNVVLRGLFKLGLANEAMDVFNSMVADNKKVMHKFELETSDSKKVMRLESSDSKKVMGIESSECKKMMHKLEPYETSGSKKVMHRLEPASDSKKVMHRLESSYYRKVMHKLESDLTNDDKKMMGLEPFGSKKVMHRLEPNETSDSKKVMHRLEPDETSFDTKKVMRFESSDSKKVMGLEPSDSKKMMSLKLSDSKKEMYKLRLEHETETRICDSTTYAIMIDGLCKCDRVEEAKLFWDDIIWPSGVHDNFVYSAMVKGLCGSGKFNEACDFVYELVDCGVKTNVVNYNILIEGAYKLGLKKEAYQMLGEMRKNGVEPDAVTWRIVHKLHNQKKVWSHEEEINVKQKHICFV